MRWFFSTSQQYHLIKFIILHRHNFPEQQLLLSLSTILLLSIRSFSVVISLIYFAKSVKKQSIILDKIIYFVILSNSSRRAFFNIHLFRWMQFSLFQESPDHIHTVTYSYLEALSPQYDLLANEQLQWAVGVKGLAEGHLSNGEGQMLLLDFPHNDLPWWSGGFNQQCKKQSYPTSSHYLMRSRI